ncbi:hypothetical protein EUX98_g8492 [Antrodiella citrinella]|uniref:Uncharacterized protein n=1 Tax=Antrodiella citrinella TaxID=2447956 RepID=A0A4S4M6N2_9APHY|nr:hypothetical protein EUX98_g8492 [Antrodiella citrinella]
MARNHNDVHVLRSILRTPPTSPSQGAVNKVYADWTPQSSLPYHAVSTRQVMINRHRDVESTYTPEQYDRTPIKPDREETRRLKMRRTSSIHLRDDFEDEESVGAPNTEDMSHATHDFGVDFVASTILNDANVGTNPRPQTPHPSRRARLPSLFSESDRSENELDSPDAYKFPTSTDEEDRAEAWAKFRAGKSFVLPSALTAVANSASEEDDKTPAFTGRGITYAKQNDSPHYMIRPPNSPSPYQTTFTLPDDFGASGSPSRSRSTPKHFPAFSPNGDEVSSAGSSKDNGGRIVRSRKRSVPVQPNVSFSNSSFSLNLDEGALGGF